MRIRGIRKDLLSLLLQLGREQHPNEFAGLLREQDGVIEEINLLPGTTSNEYSASLFLDMMPLDTHLAGSAHSHPNGVPATIAFLDGELHIGLTDVQLERLANEKEPYKVGPRDFATVITEEACGGTTVAGTMFACKNTPIKVFATGGIGGVHRETPFDVSAVLQALATIPMIVVCAGAKAILDLPATLEYLETMGVPVLGYGTDEFPAFYSRESGLDVSAQVDTPQEVVDFAKAHWEAGLQSGILVANPLPPSESISKSEMEGVSMLYTVDDAKAADRHTTQYFEIFGNRAIYHDGWVAATRHSIPWLLVPKLPDFADDVWELYHVSEDFSQADNLAEKNPQKLKELQELFMTEAIRNHVLPIDDRRSERFDPAVAGRPDLLGGRKSLTVYQGMTGIMENAFINVRGVHHTVTAELEVKDARTDGVIIAQAGYFGGWALYMKAGTTATWQWEHERITGILIETEAYDLEDHLGSTQHNRPEDIQWVLEKVRWLFEQAGVPCLPMVVE